MLKTMAVIFSIPLLAQADFNINFKPFIKHAVAQEQSIDRESLHIATQALTTSAHMNGTAESDPQMQKLMSNINQLMEQTK